MVGSLCVTMFSHGCPGNQTGRWGGLDDTCSPLLSLVKHATIIRNLSKNKMPISGGWDLDRRGGKKGSREREEGYPPTQERGRFFRRLRSTRSLNRGPESWKGPNRLAGEAHLAVK